MRRLACIGLTLAGLTAIAPAPAQAASVFDIPSFAPRQFRALLRKHVHAPRPQVPFESRLSLRTPQGYELVVLGEGDVVAVEVSRPTRHRAKSLFDVRNQSISAYFARGIVTRRRLKASFGRFGEVDLRFRPSGRIENSRPGGRCRGADHFTRRFGVYAGGIRFKGEDRYVNVRAHRAKGRIRSPLHLHCVRRHRFSAQRIRRRPVGSHPNFKVTFFNASARHALAANELFAISSPKLTLFLAVGEESLGSVARMHLGVTVASAKAFRLDDAATRATVDPPSPFHGKGFYRAAIDGTATWTGPLSVSFPGAPRTPLTGEQFEVNLSAGF